MNNKKKKWIWLSIGITIAVLVILAVIITVALTNKGYRVLKMEYHEGNVELERENAQAKLFDGINLKSGDCITTGESALAELWADSDKHMVAEENTRFSIVASGNEEKGRIRINLEYGTALFEIEKKLPEGSEFEVTTPNATLSVRGTTFEVTYDRENNKTIVMVTEGVVEVETSEETRNMEAGKTAYVIGSGAVYEEDITSEEPSKYKIPLPAEDIAYYLRGLVGGKNNLLGIKKLEGWEYDKSSGSFSKEGVELQYFLGNNYEIPDSMPESVLFLEKMYNSDGEEITVVCMTSVLEDEYGVPYYILYKQMNAEQHLGIVVKKRSSDRILTRNDISVFLEITRNQYFVMEGVDTTEAMDPSAFSEYLEVLGISYSELKYLVEIAGFCHVGQNENYVAAALSEMWFDPERVPQSAVVEGKSLTYDIQKLNHLYSYLTGDVITENNKSPMSSIRGNELVYQLCDEMTFGWIEVKITDMGYGSGDEIYIRYDFVRTYAASETKITGTSVAYFAPNNDGHYRLHTFEDFDWDTITKDAASGVKI